jgi:phosphatidate cytidylyltransferase
VAGPRNERDRGSEEDLFEDLDQFFAPLDEPEWTGEDDASRPPDQTVDPAAAEAVEADLDALEIDIPAEEELLAGLDEEQALAEAAPDAPRTEAQEPASAHVQPEVPPSEDLEAAEAGADLFEPEPDEVSLAELELTEEDLDLGVSEPAASEPIEAAASEQTEAGAAPGTGAEPAEAPPPPGLEEEVDLGRWDPGAEEDWAAAAAELAEPAEPPAAAQTPAPGEPFEPAEPAPAEPPEEPVTVDDLQVPPPQYADLPGPDDLEGEDVAAGAEDEEGVASLGDLEGVATAGTGDEGVEEPTFPQAPVEASGKTPSETAAGVGPGAADEEPGPGAEPASGEAAADHFAEGIPPEEIERELLADLGPPGEETVQIDTEAASTAAEQQPDPVDEGASLGPPTWEEAGAQPVEPELEEAAPPPEAPTGGRNLVAAFASGILLAVMVIALLVIGKGFFAVFAGLVILFGQAEFYAVMQARGYKPATLMGLVAGALLIAGAYLRGDAAVLFGVFVAMTASALWYMAGSPATRKGSTGNIAATLLGVLYVPGLASFAILLLALPGDVGRNVFLVVVGLTILYDVCAYAVGSWFGSRPLAPTISPSKSWEGAIGATVVLLLVSLAAVPAIDPFTSSTAVGLAILIAIAAPIGDLIESAFKRDLGVKDMGTILPGHGGILDRIDAILVAAPVAYYFLRIAFL